VRLGNRGKICGLFAGKSCVLPYLSVLENGVVGLLKALYKCPGLYLTLLYYSRSMIDETGEISPL